MRSDLVQHEFATHRDITSRTREIALTHARRRVWDDSPRESMGDAVTDEPIDVDEVADAVRKSKLSVALIDLTTLDVVAHSAAATTGLGYRADADLDILEVAADPVEARTRLAEVRDGRFDAFEVSAAVRRADGSVVDGVVWVRALDPRAPRSHAVVMLRPADAAAGAVMRPDVSAMLALDPEQRVSRLNADAEGVLGHTRATAIGHELGDLVHPDDAETLVRTLAAAAAQRTCANQVRVRGAGGEWHTVDLTAAPGGTDTVACRAAPAEPMSPTASVASARVAELERHLTRIAREVEAAGVIRDGATVLDPERVPELAHLTARQWEILVRLLRGERVPTIARGMFLSQSTVRNYLSAMYQRLGVHSQAELIERFGTHDARRDTV